MLTWRFQYPASPNKVLRLHVMWYWWLLTIPTHRFKSLPGWHPMGKHDKDLLRGLSTFKNSYKSFKVPLFTTAKSHRAHLEINQLSFNLLNVWRECCDSGIPRARPQKHQLFLPLPCSMGSLPEQQECRQCLEPQLSCKDRSAG